MSPEGVEARKLMEALKSDLPADGEDDGIAAQLDDALVKALNSLARLVLGEKTAPVSDRPPPANWEAMRLHVQRTRILKAIAALRQTESCNCRKYRAVLQKNADLFKPRRPDGPWEDVLYQLKAIAKDMRRRIAKEEHSFTAQQRERHVADLAASYETRSKDFYRRAKAAAGPSSPLSRVKVDVPAPGVSADPDTVKSVLRSYVGDTFRKQPPPASNRDDAGQHPWFHTPTFLQTSARLRARSAEITRQMPLAELRQTLERSAKGKAAGPNGLPMECYLWADDEFLEMQLAVLNAVLRGDDPPPSWGQSRIQLVYKGTGDTADPAFYRPIALLNTSYKMLAKTLTFRTMTLLEELQIISNAQGGWRNGRNCHDKINSLVGLIALAKDSKR
jgi:hypothetical protein